MWFLVEPSKYASVAVSKWTFSLSQYLVLKFDEDLAVKPLRKKGPLYSNDVGSVALAKSEPFDFQILRLMAKIE